MVLKTENTIRMRVSRACRAIAEPRTCGWGDSKTIRSPSPKRVVDLQPGLFKLVLKIQALGFGAHSGVGKIMDGIRRRALVNPWSSPFLRALGRIRRQFAANLGVGQSGAVFVWVVTTE